MENCQTPKSASLLTAARYMLAQPSRNDLHFTAQFSIEMGTELLSLRSLPTSRKISCIPAPRCSQECRQTHSSAVLRRHGLHTHHPAQPQPVLETANLTHDFCNASGQQPTALPSQLSPPFPSFDPLHPFRGKDHSF